LALARRLSKDGENSGRTRGRLRDQAVGRESCGDCAVSSEKVVNVLKLPC